jgi:hypothetical protein
MTESRWPSPARHHNIQYREKTRPQVTDTDRHYSDQEVALILRKAAQLDTGAAAPDAGEGLSLAEIERIAREVGIAPDVVARAAALISSEVPGTAARIFGGPANFRAEHEAGGTLPRERYGDVVEAIQRALDKSGKVSEVLDGLEWQTEGETTRVTVAVRPAAGRTRVQILVDRGGSAVLAYLPFGLAALIGGAATGAILEPGLGGGILIMGTALGTGFLAARTIWSAATRRFRRTFASLTDAVNTAVEHHVEPVDDSTT